MLSEKLLVSTKFAPPRLRAQLVRRNRLLHQLQRDQACRLTTITGSAGFGKTTLLAQWRQHVLTTGADVAWLSLSQHDQGFIRFCSYLIGAIQHAGVPVEDDAILLAEERSENAIEEIEALLINAISNHGKEIVLLIDDYHYVSDPLCHELTQAIVDHGPENLRITIASRDTVPMNLPRLRVLGQLSEIDNISLPFDFKETVEFFSANSGGAIEPHELRMIYDACAGWPAGLQLVAHGVTTRSLDKLSIRALAQKTRNVGGYIKENVLPHMSAEMIECSENLSICSRFNLDLARHLMKAPLPNEVVVDIERNQLFITPIDLDDGYNWFRFHPLFSDFMRERLVRRGTKAFEDLNRRAGEWFASRGFLIDAIHHARLAGRLDLVVDFVERSPVNLPALSHLGSVRHLFTQLDPRELLPHVKLLLLGSWVFVLAAQPAKAEKWIEQILLTEAANKPQIEIQLRFLSAALAVYYDDTSKALQLVEPLEDAVAGDRLLRQVRVIHLMTGYAVEGRYEEAVRIFRSGANWPQEEINDDLALIAEASVAAVSLLEGDVREAERRGLEVLAHAEAAHGRRSVSATVCAAFLADALYELDRIEAAQETLANRIDMLRFANPDPMIRAMLVHAKLNRIQNGWRAALAFLEEEEDRFRKRSADRALACALAEKATITLSRGDYRAASLLQDELDHLAAKHSSSMGFLAEIPAIAGLARSRLALAEQKPDEALKNLKTVSEYSNNLRRGRMAVTAGLLAGLAFHKMNNKTASDQHLTQAIELSSQLGLTRTILDEGPELLDLLRRRSGGDMLAQEAIGYLESFFEKAATSSVYKESREAHSLEKNNQSTTLTPREQEIVALLAQSMSNKRIALTLNISPQTVKWNLKNVFARLGISCRYDVIVWARQNGYASQEQFQHPPGKKPPD